MTALTPVLAHPLTETARLGVAPAFVAVGVAVLAVAAARVLGGAAAPGGRAAAAPDHVPARVPLTAVGGPWWLTTRVAGVVVLAIAVLDGRLGPPQQLDNAAPALVVGAGWPLLLVGQALTGHVWRFVDPFDSLARTAARAAGQPGPEVGDGWRAPAVVPGRPGVDAVLRWLGVAVAAGWGWWLAGFLPGGLDPRAVGLAVGIYAAVTTAGCLLAGRRRWLSQVEVLGTAMGALAAARPRHPRPQDPAALLPMAVLLGAVAFAELRFSRWYVEDLEALGIDPFTGASVAIGFLLAVGLAVAAALGARRWGARLGSDAPVRTALPWALAGAALSAALERDRLWTSVQVVAARAVEGLSGAEVAITGWPFGDLARVWLQVLVWAAAATGGLLACRRAATAGREPAVALLVAALVVGVLSAASL